MNNINRLFLKIIITCFISVFSVVVINAQEGQKEEKKSVKTGDKIYTWIDNKGDRIYSDVPREGAEVMEIEKGTDYAAPSLGKPDWSTLKPTVVKESVGYEHFQIVSPANEATVRNNLGNIQIALDVRPKLRAGHRIKLEMDGKEVSGTGSIISLTGIDRGAHTFIAHILDADEKLIQSTSAIVVFMHRAIK